MIRFKIKKKHYIKNILILIGLFCIIFNPPIVSINSLHINSMHIVGAVSWIYLVVVFLFNRREVSISFFGLLVAFLLITLYLTVVITFNEMGNYAELTSPLIIMVDVIPFGYLLKRNYDTNNYTYVDVFHMFLCVSLTQVIIIFFSFFSKTFHSFLIERFTEYGYSELVKTLSSFRMYGFAAGLTYSTPIFLSFMSLLTLYYALLNKKHLYLIATVLLALSSIINARTSFVVLIIGFILMLIDNSIEIRIKTKLVWVSAIMFFVVLFIVLPVLNSSNNETYVWAAKGLDEIINLFKGNTGNGYFSYLTDKTHFTVPENIVGILFGKGDSVFGEYATEKRGWSSDIGYINDLWKGGIIYILIYYGIIFGIFIKLRNAKIPIFSYGALLCVVMYPFLLIKGRVCDMNDITNTMIILYLLMGQSKGKNMIS